MLGMFSLFPLLKGWEYKIHDCARTTVRRGDSPLEVLRMEEWGWLLHILELTDDAYGTFDVNFQGADLETLSWTFYPEVMNQIGAFAQDPGGWLQEYVRPNPFSTAGLYVLAAFSGGYQGSAWPFLPTTVLRLRLPTDSTQESANIRLVAAVVAITDRRLFIQSLRCVLDQKLSLTIDPRLLAAGPAVFGGVSKGES